MTASLYETARDRGLSGPGDGDVLSSPIRTMLRPKGSMLFNGKIVEEAPKGEEDPFLEMHAYKKERSNLTSGVFHDILHTGRCTSTKTV